MRQFAVFSVGEKEFGVDILRVVEILNPVKIFPIPDMPSFLSGVINLRGIIIPVIDLRKKFNVDSIPDRERILIVWVSSRRVGLLVDSVKEIMDFSDDEIASATPIFKGFNPEYLVGIGRKEDRVVMLLNTDTVLSEEEKTVLQESKESMELTVDEGSRKTSQE